MVEGDAQSAFVYIFHQFLQKRENLISFPWEKLKPILGRENLVSFPWERLKPILGNLVSFPWEKLKPILGRENLISFPWEKLKPILGRENLFSFPWEKLKPILGRENLFSFPWEKLKPIPGKAQQLGLAIPGKLFDSQAQLGKAVIAGSILLAPCLFPYCCSRALVMLSVCCCRFFRLCGEALKMMFCCWYRTAPKMMKAPGQVGVKIVRATFEMNTKAYFLALRAASKAIV